MLKLLVASSVASMVFGAIEPEILKPHRNTDVSSNYVVQTWSGIPFAFPFDFCIPDGLLASTWKKYSCSANGMTVTVGSYGVDDCSDTPSEVTIAKSDCTSTDTSLERAIGCFECDADDAYAEIQLTIFSTECAAPLSTVPSALGVCVRSSDTNYTYQAFCEGTQAYLDYFAYDSGCEVDSAYEYSYSAEAECGPLLTAFTKNIYSKLTDCTEDVSTTSKPDGVARFASPIAAFALVIAAFLLR